jgi:hypothetical protein
MGRGGAGYCQSRSKLTPNRLPILTGTTSFISLVACLVCLSLAAQNALTDGLALWLEADAGVSTDISEGGTMWVEQPPHANDAYGSELADARPADPVDQTASN